jgi:hypothetical protein
MMPVSPIKKLKRTISAEVQAKGAAALADWRKRKAAAVKKGGKFLAKWEADEALKKALKKTTPMQAIKQFCLNCVGDVRKDIRECTATKCPLYIYRPYQTDDAD